MTLDFASMARIRAPQLVLCAAALTACAPPDPGAGRARAEKAVLERQVAGLRELVSLAEAGTLTTPEQILIGVDEAIVRDLIAATLPLERTVARRFVVRLERAEVSFRASQSTVTLRGRVSAAGSPETFADLVLVGGFERMEVNPFSQRLRADVGLYHFQVERAAAAGAENALVRALVEDVARQNVDDLQEAVPPIEIPVRLEQAVEIEGLGDGPVSAAPGRLPLSIAVARVLPLDGRLWVVVNAAAGRWERPAAAGGGR